MQKKDKIKISRKYLDKLQQAEIFLNALHEKGVGEWDGYEDAMELYMKNNKH